MWIVYLLLFSPLILTGVFLILFFAFKYLANLYVPEQKKQKEDNERNNKSGISERVSILINKKTDGSTSYRMPNGESKLEYSKRHPLERIPAGTWDGRESFYQDGTLLVSEEQFDKNVDYSV